MAVAAIFRPVTRARTSALDLKRLPVSLSIVSFQKQPSNGAVYVRVYTFVHIYDCLHVYII